MIAGFKAQNHPQQIAARGALDAVDDRGTPWELIHELEARPGWGPFDLDVAAAEHNTKAPNWYGRHLDGLEQPWNPKPGLNVWCNPPFSACGAWVRKAWDEWAKPGRPRRIVMLLPANRGEQKWWQDLVEPFRDRGGSPLRCEFLPGRQRFIRPGVETPAKGDRPPFGCLLLIWSDWELVPE